MPTVTGTTVCDNVPLASGAGYSGAGIQNQGAGGAYGVILSQDLIYGNTASDGGGGYNPGWGGYSTITDTAITNNVTLNGSGGGVYFWGGAYLSMSNSIIADNTAAIGGGISNAHFLNLGNRYPSFDIGPLVIPERPDSH